MVKVKVALYDNLGFVVGEPLVPSEPEPPHVLIWGDEVFLRGEEYDPECPRYIMCSHYVIPETRETPSY